MVEISVTVPDFLKFGWLCSYFWLTKHPVELHRTQLGAETSRQVQMWKVTPPLMHPDNTSAFQNSGSWSCPGWRAKLFCQEQPYSKFERTKSKWDQTKPHDLIVNVRKALLECVLPAPCSRSIQVFIQVWYWGVLAREDLRCPLDFYITALTLAAQIGCWCSCGWWNN